MMETCLPQRPSVHPGTLGRLIERLSPLDPGGERSVILLSRTEYEAIPARWHFLCQGACFRLKEKCWSAQAGRGTAIFHLW